jgi:predicted nucleic acid-binding protein
MRVLIDTRIWVLALRAPVAPAGSSLARLGERARELVVRLREEATILFTPQLVGEIRHVLTSRGSARLPAAVARDYLHQLLADRRSRFRTLSRRQLQLALDLSAESGVHLWDYLVVLPWQGQIDRLLTMDPHYRHPHFREVGPVENPLGLWRHEGQPLG